MINKNNRVRRYIDDIMVDEPVVIFESPSYETAFIGLESETNRAVYDFDKMVQYLIDQDGVDPNEAVDFICFNTLRALPYQEGAPIVVETVDLSFYD